MPMPNVIETAPIASFHALASIFACGVCAINEGDTAPSPVSALLAICSTRTGQLAVLNLCGCYALLVLRAAQWTIFGKLRVIEWQVYIGSLSLVFPAPLPLASSLACAHLWATIAARMLTPHLATHDWSNTAARAPAAALGEAYQSHHGAAGRARRCRRA